MEDIGVCDKCGGEMKREEVLVCIECGLVDQKELAGSIEGTKVVVFGQKALSSSANGFLMMSNATKFFIEPSSYNKIKDIFHGVLAGIGIEFTSDIENFLFEWYFKYKKCHELNPSSSRRFSEELVAVTMVFAYCRCNVLPFSLMDIATTSKYRTLEINRCFEYVSQLIGIEKHVEECSDPLLYIRKLCGQIGILDREVQSVVHNRCNKLYGFFESCGIISGRNPRGLAVAILYIGLISLYSTDEIQKLATDISFTTSDSILQSLADRMKISVYTSKERVHEMEKSLLKLGSLLPWKLSNNFKKELPQIMKHFEELLILQNLGNEEKSPLITLDDVKKKRQRSNKK